jgi:hypothetical protein
MISGRATDYAATDNGYLSMAWQWLGHFALLSLAGAALFFCNE